MAFARPSAARIPPRLLAQRREVQRRWNAGETASVIGTALGVSARTVHSVLARLRLDGARLRPARRWGVEQTEAPVRDPGLAATLRAVAPSSVTVYDASGRPIARIDPQTRTRRAW
jgi:hypothetical protein